MEKARFTITTFVDRNSFRHRSPIKVSCTSLLPPRLKHWSTTTFMFIPTLTTRVVSSRTIGTASFIVVRVARLRHCFIITSLATEQIRPSRPFTNAGKANVYSRETGPFLATLRPPPTYTSSRTKKVFLERL